MKLAAIDLGSNSIHMVVVDVTASGGLTVIGQHKEMVRLGAATLASGHLSAKAMKRGLATLRNFKRLADTQGAEKILAVATSAVREAGNGERFLKQIGRELRVWPRVVSGEEEARLIYLAALHSVHLEGKRALVIDIGGGSVELALGTGQRLERTQSFKLGVLRMNERFVTSDPLSAKDEKRLSSHIEKRLKDDGAQILEAGFDCAVGTSGTILALGALAHQMEAGQAAESLHHVTVKAETLHALRKRLVSTDLKARLRIPGLDERRADIIVPGAVILDTVLDRLGVKELVLCEWALREGLLLDYIHGHPRSLARAAAYPDVRRRGVVDLAERCLYDEAHARHTAALALSLFDQTRRRHGLPDAARSLLEYAALLHDIGHHISYPAHHKHSYYLIKNGDLRGFSPQEIEVLALVARYHRRGHPRRKQEGFAALPRDARRTVTVLAGLLRIADVLDRSHRQTVREVTVKSRGGVLRILARAERNCELELWGAPGRVALLEEALGVTVRIQAAAAERRGAVVRARRA